MLADKSETNLKQTFGLSTQQKLRFCPVSGLKKTKNQFFWKTLNFLKIGIMFGFFIDAFKVGS